MSSRSSPESFNMPPQLYHSLCGLRLRASVHVPVYALKSRLKSMHAIPKGLASCGVTATRVLPRVLDAPGFSAMRGDPAAGPAAATVTVPLDGGLRDWVSLFLREAVRNGRWDDGFSVLRRLWRKLGCRSEDVDGLDFSVRAPWDVRALSTRVSTLLQGYVIPDV